MYPPEPDVHVTQIRAHPPPCCVKKCKRKTTYGCTKLMCFTHCAEEPPCLCEKHANPKGQRPTALAKVIRDQLDSNKMHRKKIGGRILPGPMPAKALAALIPREAPAISKKARKPRQAYVLCSSLSAPSLPPFTPTRASSPTKALQLFTESQDCSATQRTKFTRTKPSESRLLIYFFYLFKQSTNHALFFTQGLISAHPCPCLQRKREWKRGWSHRR